MRCLKVLLGACKCNLEDTCVSDTCSTLAFTGSLTVAFALRRAPQAPPTAIVAFAGSLEIK